MDSRLFYGKRGLRTHLPPEDKSDDSCLSDSEDDDVVPYHHTQARVSSSSSEDEDKDAVDEPSASRKRAVRWKKPVVKNSEKYHPGKALFLRLTLYELLSNISRTFLMTTSWITSLSRAMCLRRRKIPTKDLLCLVMS
ncbi:hypothetical protein MRX96_033919 [Rhipicephalus microplus]